MKTNLNTPDFLIPGFAKSGTSSLHEYLNQHPEILMSTIKEPHNYSNMEYYVQRYKPEAERSFPNLFNHEKFNTTILLGESSTSYSVCDYSPKLIYDDNPNMKFIFIARDPIERIRSHYNWLLSFGKVEKDFCSEIEDWLNKKFDINNHVDYGYKYYTDHSLYGSQLKNYLSFFDIKNFHFLSAENLKMQPEVELKKCFAFLGVDQNIKINTVVTNQTKTKEKKYDIPKKYSLLKSILPLTLKRKLKENFAQKYEIQEKIKPIKELNEKEITWLKTILRDDINLFKQLSQYNFTEWKYFN